MELVAWVDQRGVCTQHLAPVKQPPRGAKARSMRRLLIIGMGAGNPEHLTLQAVRALNAVDVFFVLDKGQKKGDLARLRKELCARHIEDPSYRSIDVLDPLRDETIVDYGERVERWHAERAGIFESLLSHELGPDEVGGLLVWGDPSLYDSTLRVVERVLARGNVELEYEVIPGITSVQALTASHKISLNQIGGGIHITTGRKLAEGVANELLSKQDNVVVMLDGECAFKKVEGGDVQIYWAAYAGTEREILLAGKLSVLKEEIERVRASARAENGWIMDTYLLRKSSEED
jgi:precorrin-6A synthase